MDTHERLRTRSRAPKMSMLALGLMVSCLFVSGAGCNLYRTLDEGPPPDAGHGGDVIIDVHDNGDTLADGDGQIEDAVIPRDPGQDVTAEEDTRAPGDVESDTANGDVDSPDAVEPPPAREPERSREGLILYYTLDEGTGDAASDSSDLAPAFDLDVVGGVSWLAGGGVRLGGGHLIRMEPPAKVYDALGASGAFSLELWMRAGVVNQGSGSNSGARILSLAGGSGQSNLVLGQLGTRLEVRLRSGQALDGSPYLVMSGAISTQLAHYVLTYNGAEVVLYLNGQELVRSPRQGNLDRWDGTYGLILGDGFALETPWRGEILHVALYDRLLSAEEIEDHHALGF